MYQPIHVFSRGDHYLTRLGLFAATLAVAALCMPIKAWAGKSFLWVGIYAAPGIQRYSPRQLKRSGDPTPSALSTFDFVSGLAFDKKHNLWATVEDGNTFELVKFTRAQLKSLHSTPNPTPAVVIASSQFEYPNGLAFDHAGNLWVADAQASELFEFSSTQLQSSGADVAPAIAISSADLDGPFFVIFDKRGDAWASNYYGGKTIVEFTAGQLSTTSTQSASVVISDDGNHSIDGPAQIALDRHGNLWVADFYSSTVVKFSKAQIAQSGDPTPVVTLSGPDLDSPWGLIFVHRNLVVANYDTGTIARFKAKQVKTSGTPTPVAYLNANTNAATSVSQMIAGPKL